MSILNNNNLATFLLAIIECEKQTEIVRQILAEQNLFEPFTAFRRLDQKRVNYLKVEDLQDFLNDNGVNFRQDQILFLFNNIDADQDGVVTINDFVKAILPRNNSQLKELVTIRDAYFIDVNMLLPNEVEYSLAKLFSTIMASQSQIFQFLFSQRQLSLAANRLANSLKTSNHKLVDLLLSNSQQQITPETLQEFLQKQQQKVNEDDLSAFFQSFTGNLQAFLAFNQLEQFISFFLKSKEEKPQQQPSNLNNYQTNSTLQNSASPYQSLNQNYPQASFATQQFSPYQPQSSNISQKQQLSNGSSQYDRQPEQQYLPSEQKTSSQFFQKEQSQQQYKSYEQKPSSQSFQKEQSQQQYQHYQQKPSSQSFQKEQSEQQYQHYQQKPSSMSFQKEQSQQQYQPYQKPSSMSFQKEQPQQQFSPYQEQGFNKSSKKRELSDQQQKPLGYNQMSTPQPNKKSLQERLSEERKREEELQLERLRSLRELERIELLSRPYYSYYPYYSSPYLASSRLAVLEAEKIFVDSALEREKAAEKSRSNSIERLRRIEQEKLNTISEQRRIQNEIYREEERKRQNMMQYAGLEQETNEKIKNRVRETEQLKAMDSQSRMKYFDPTNVYPYGIINAINSYDSPNKERSGKGSERQSEQKQSDRSQQLREMKNDKVPEKSYQQESERGQEMVLP